MSGSETDEGVAEDKVQGWKVWSINGSKNKSMHLYQFPSGGLETEV